MLPRKVSSSSKPSSSGGGGSSQLVQVQYHHQILEPLNEGPNAKRSKIVHPNPLAQPVILPSVPDMSMSKVSGQNSTSLTFEDLPDEMLTNILSYLSIKDKLNARLVCTDWDIKIRTWGKFMDTLQFPLTASSTQLLEESRMGWKHIIAPDPGLTNVLPQIVPLTLRPETESNISTIKLSNLTFTWSTAQELLTSFPHLNSLSIKHCKLEHEIAEGFFQTPESCRRAINLRSQLKSLHLKVVRVEELLFFVSVFRKVPSLKQLTIHLQDFSEEQSLASRDQLLGALTTLVKSCEFKLTDLSVTGTILFQRIIVQWLRDLRIRLDLINLSLKSLSGTEKSNELSVLCIKSLIAFLKTQKNLQRLNLPPLSRDYRIIYDQLANIGPNIKAITLQSDRLLAAKFFDTFQNLQELKIKVSRPNSDDVDDEEDDDDEVDEEDFFEIDVNSPVINNKLMESVQNKIFLNMRKLWVTDCSAATLVSISISFPNVTVLTMDGTSAITDEGLQEIIRNLINLKTLTLGNCEELSDFGVSGIIQDYCASQFRSRKIYMESLAFDKGMQIGHPLSSLKHLKVFKCGSCPKVTDVGIYYGFKFSNLRQFRIRFGEKVTLWGILQLAKYNKYLERVHLTTWSSLGKTFTVDEAKSILMTTLPSILPKYIEIERD